MRHGCTTCARKHIAQASVLMDEARLGYPEHAWLAVGHLAEAESELLEEFEDLAIQVREHRVRYIESIVDSAAPYAVPVIDLISALSVYDQSVEEFAVDIEDTDGHTHNENSEGA